MTPRLVDSVKVCPSYIGGHGPGFAVSVSPHPTDEKTSIRIADAIRAAVKALKVEK
jgi:hypothetical protein